MWERNNTVFARGCILVCENFCFEPSSCARPPKIGHCPSPTVLSSIVPVLSLKKHIARSSQYSFLALAHIAMSSEKPPVSFQTRHCHKLNISLSLREFTRLGAFCLQPLRTSIFHPFNISGEGCPPSVHQCRPRFWRQIEQSQSRTPSQHKRLPVIARITSIHPTWCELHHPRQDPSIKRRRVLPGNKSGERSVYVWSRCARSL